MSYTLIRRDNPDGTTRFIAQVKLLNGKWRQYQTRQTDEKKAHKVAQRIERAIEQGEDPNAFTARLTTRCPAKDERLALAGQIEAYLDEKHETWAQGTFPGYKIPLYLFRDFMGDVNVNQIAETDLLAFRKFLKKRGRTVYPKGKKKEWRTLAPKTLRNYEDAVQFFLNWAGKRLKFQAPHIDRIPLPESKPIHYWKPDECVDLLKAAQEIVVRGQPYALYLGFLFSTGMRRTEAALMRWEWVDMGSRSIRLPGRDPETGTKVTKNGKWRLIPISDTLFEMLENWPTPKKGRLFIMSEKSGHISDNFERTIERANQKRRAEGRELIPRLTPHATRHTYAVQSLQAGMDLFALAQILGHASTDVTIKHYAMLALPELHRQVAKAGSWHEALSKGFIRPSGATDTRAA